jgi:hypothetical protein
MPNDEPKLSEILGRAGNVPEPKSFTAEVEKYAPPSIRKDKKADSRLQTIGQFIVSLTYKEAMAMGRGIHAKLGKDSSVIVAEELTGAIQDWAWEWKKFLEEEQPGGE